MIRKLYQTCNELVYQDIDSFGNWTLYCTLSYATYFHIKSIFMVVGHNMETFESEPPLVCSWAVFNV